MRKPFNGDYPISQKFSNKLIIDGADVYGRWNLKGHNGIDYALPTGTEIISPIKGFIKEAAFDDGGYGWYIKIENDNQGFVLGHLKNIDVQIGQEVAEGQHLGFSDNSGFSTGPHLHAGYYSIPRNRDNGYNGFEDQLPLMNEVQKPKIIIKVKYTVGSIVETDKDYETSKIPGVPAPGYGHIGRKYPAQIIGYKVVGTVAFYNIDQKDIGGGTGYIAAEVLDAAETAKDADERRKIEQQKDDDVIVPNVPSNNDTTSPNEVEQTFYTQDDINKLNKQLEIAQKECDAAINQKKDIEKKLSAFSKVGFDNADEVIAIVNQNTELQRQNDILTNTLKGKENTAIKKIETFIKELIDYKDKLLKASKGGFTKAEMMEVIGESLNIIKNIEEIYNTIQDELQTGKNNKIEVQIIENKAINNLPPMQIGWDWLMSVFGLKEKQ